MCGHAIGQKHPPLPIGRIAPDPSPWPNSLQGSNTPGPTPQTQQAGTVQVDGPNSWPRAIRVDTPIFLSCPQ